MLSHVQFFCDPMDCSPPVSCVHGDSLDKNTGMGCHALLQGIFPTQGSNPGLPHCRQILYRLSHQGSPMLLVKVKESCLTLCDHVEYTVHGTLQARLLEWVAKPSSRGSSQPRGRTQVSRIAAEPLGNALCSLIIYISTSAPTFPPQKTPVIVCPKNLYLFR